LICFQSDFYSQSNALFIEFFSPQNQIKQVKQVQVRFSEPIVALGDPRPKSDLFKINCPFPGIPRWIDSSTWVYEFETELPGGVICKFDINAEIKSLKGNILTGDRSFSFNTGGPSIRYSSPYSGNVIDEDQIFILDLDAEADLDSVKKFAFFSIAELNNKIPVQIVDGKERRTILKTQEREDTKNILLLRAKQTFLPQKNIQLIWGKGIKAVLGGEITEDEIHNYTVRSPFSVSFSCERVNAKSDCIPMLPFRMHFTSNVSKEYLKKITLKSKDGSIFESDYSKDTPGDEGSTYLSFAGPFPENSEFVIHIPDSITDDMGRKLVNIGNFPLTVKSAEFPPLAKFAAKFGILELNANPAIPVTVRNIEAQIPMIRQDLSVSLSSQRTLDPSEIQKWFLALAKHQREKSLFSTRIGASIPSVQTLPKPNGKKPMEVIGIPLEKPGFYVVELASDILGANLLEKKGKMYVVSSALVTNLSVHLKWGGESSLVWVTSLDKAQPEAGVIVKIVDCKGVTRITGVTGKEGTFKFGKLSGGEIPYCGYYEMGSGLTVFAQKGDDVSFTSSTWDQGIESWRFNLPSYSYHDASEIQTVVLDRTLFRAGETVHLKHFRRGHSISGLTAADPKKYPKKVMIQHDGSGEKYSFPIVWSFPGTTESEFTIPKNARLGNYRVYYPTSEEDDSYGNIVTNFKVEEFRLPVLRGGIQLKDNKNPLVSPKKINVDLNLQYLSGGGASLFPVQIRGQVSPAYYSPKDDDAAFQFNPEVIETGKVLVSGYSEEDTDSQSSSHPQIFKSDKLTLDEKGFGSYSFDGFKEWKGDSALDVEMEYLDPSGEIQTVYRRFPVFVSDLHIGIQPKGWMFSQNKVEMQILALDINDKPKKNQKITVKAYSQKYYSNRRRLVGGYYAYEHYREVTELGVYCQGKTNDKGILFCEGKAPASGEIIFSAEAEDQNGYKTNSTYNAYIASSEDSWFEVTDHNRMDIIPEKKYIEIGETLKLQLRSPFREATALVTVEREGIIDSFIYNVSGKEPIVTIPIKKEYAPNVYLSALLIRGRIGEPKATALVDLARPSFRLGITPLRVGWKPYELAVSVNTSQTKYKVRENVSASVAVKDYLGKVPKAGGEVLVAVVDEALLELSPNPTWKLLDAMMGLRGHDVSTSTGQSQIIGRRHFGLKAKPSGGSGGKSPTRSLFNTLVYWKGKLTLDKEGKANFQFPLNDSLTSFKIVAVVSSGVYEFGTGSTSIQTNQDIQTFSGIPSVAREGDVLEHEFTIRNASSESKNLKLKLKVVDVARSSGKQKSPEMILGEKEISAGASSSIPVLWKLEVPKDTLSRKFELEVSDPNGVILDRLSAFQNISEVTKESVYMAGLQQLDGKFEESLKSPIDAVAGSSKFTISVSPSLLNNMNSVEHYFQKYPYNCMEQKVSKAIGLKSNNHWRQIDEELGGYLDENGLVKFFPRMDHGSEILTSYILTSSKLVGYNLREDIVTKMMEGLRGYLAGNVRGDYYTFGADLVLRKIIVTEALYRYETIEWDMISSLFSNIELLPTSSIIDLSEIVTRIPPKDDKIKSRLANVLRSRLNLQGTELVIADKNFASPWWIMGSEDYTMAKLTLWTLKENSYKKDLPRIIKGLLKKQIKGKWDTTLGNAYGILAVENIGKILETEKVQGGMVTVFDLGKELPLDPTKPEGASLTLPVTEKEKNLSITYNGKGKPWLSWQARSKLPLKSPLNSGYSIKRSIIPVIQKKSGSWTRGDVLKIRLQITADSDKTWVVVEDPIPSGSIHLGKGLAKESKILSGMIRQESTYGPSFEERSFTHFRSFYEYLPQGEHVIEYTIQLNQIGNFSLPSARVEAMYSPEVFGEVPIESLQISGEEP